MGFLVELIFFKKLLVFWKCILEQNELKSLTSRLEAMPEAPHKKRFWNKKKESPEWFLPLFFFVLVLFVFFSDLNISVTIGIHKAKLFM
jgi:hypothetical protein